MKYTTQFSNLLVALPQKYNIKVISQVWLVKCTHCRLVSSQNESGRQRENIKHIVEDLCAYDWSLMLVYEMLLVVYEPDGLPFKGLVLTGVANDQCDLVSDHFRCLMYVMYFPFPLTTFLTSSYFWTYYFFLNHVIRASALKYVISSEFLRLSLLFSTNPCLLNRSTPDSSAPSGVSVSLMSYCISPSLFLVYTVAGALPSARAIQFRRRRCQSDLLIPLAYYNSINRANQ